jgi:hypothetical protein
MRLNGPAEDSHIRSRREAAGVAMKQGPEGWSWADDRLAVRAWEGRFYDEAAPPRGVPSQSRPTITSVALMTA